MTFKKLAFPDFIAHTIGLVSFTIVSLAVVNYVNAHNKGLPYLFNILGIIMGIMGFSLMLWAGSRRVNLPRGLVSVLNSDETPNQVAGTPWPNTWMMGIVYVVIGMLLQLISVMSTP